MRLKIIKLARTLLNILIGIGTFFLFAMMLVVNAEVDGGVFTNEGNGSYIVFGTATFTKMIDGVATTVTEEGPSFINTVVYYNRSFFSSVGSIVNIIVYVISAGVFIYAIVNLILCIKRRRGKAALLSPIFMMIQMFGCVWFTGVTIISTYIHQGTIFALTIFGYMHVFATFLTIPMNVIFDILYDNAVKKFNEEKLHEKFKDTAYQDTNDTTVPNRANRNNVPVRANGTNGIPVGNNGQEIFLNISLSDLPGMQNLQASNYSTPRQFANANVTPSNNQPQMANAADSNGNNNSGPQMARASDRPAGPRLVSNDDKVNSILAPTSVHAPGRGQRNAGRDALAELEAKEKHNTAADIRFARRNNAVKNDDDDDEKETEAKKPEINSQVDLAAFGIDVTTIKTEEDYKAALEKILSGNLQPILKEEEDDIPDPNENELDYELQQIEDSDLTDDEVRELKLIIGDPSNMTFIEKFQAADEDLRKKYLKLRKILLSSKEKRLESRITRYFDTYRWHNRIVARITIQGKTIKLFLALDPKDYEGKRISISNESSKLIYHAVPTLIRVRTDLSYKNAKKLISDLLGKRENDMYEPPVVEFKEKKVDLDYKPVTEEPKLEEKPVEEEKKQEVSNEETSSEVTSEKETLEPKPEENGETLETSSEENKENTSSEETNEESESKENASVNEETSSVDEGEESKDENEESTSDESAEESIDNDEAEEFDVEFDEFGNEIKHDELMDDSQEEVNEFEEETDKQNSESDEEVNEELDDDEDSDDESSDEDGDDEEDGVPTKKPLFAPRDPNAPVIPRKTFAEKIVEAEDPELPAHYNELKNYLCSFGVNGRISKSNESFRFKKELYCKITVQGKTLKVFLALNPEEYAHTKIPVTDMSHKHAYAEVPCLIKVRSNLSLKRAKQLIDDMMAKKGLLQKNTNTLDYVELLSIGLNHESKY